MAFGLNEAIKELTQANIKKSTNKIMKLFLLSSNTQYAVGTNNIQIHSPLDITFHVHLQ